MRPGRRIDRLPFGWSHVRQRICRSARDARRSRASDGPVSAAEVGIHDRVIPAGGPGRNIRAVTIHWRGIGNSLHLLFSQMQLPMLIALGMVGYLAAVTQSPITAFVIVMEMINGHALVISLMATALIASHYRASLHPRSMKRSLSAIATSPPQSLHLRHVRASPETSVLNCCRLRQCRAGYIARRTLAMAEQIQRRPCHLTSHI